MARRLKSGRLRPQFLVLAAVVLALGIAAGAYLSHRLSHPSPSALLPQPPGRPPVSGPPPASAVIPHEEIDAAVQRTLPRIGTVVRTSTREETAQRGGQIFRWQTETAQVRLLPGLTTEEAAALLVKEVERAGGQVLARTPSGIRLGVVRDGVTAVTHELQFVRPEAQAWAAIIFDDAGGSLGDLDAIIALGRPVAVAVLPGLRFSREVADRARAAGLEVLLHLPVEPEDASKDLGPGGITTAMSDEEIAAAVQADLTDVPGAIGVNNHMGSRGTSDERVMRAVLQEVKARGLIFVDSVTSPRSVAGRVAGEMHVRTASRQVFLDNQNEAGAIRRQIRRLISLARRRGEALAIGHAQRLTPRVLKEMLAEFDRQGVAIVPVSAIVH